MKRITLGGIALLLLAPSWAWAEASFTRPECTPDAALTPQAAEVRCIREARRRVQDANFAALQATGLMFNYMARPDLERFPEAKAVLEKKVEGSFGLVFSVAPDGTVYNVASKDVTAGIEPLAKMWADTIGQWTFVKPGQAVTDIEHRRIYLYAREEDAESQKKPQATF
jgi:hypothetical protein